VRDDVPEIGVASSSGCACSSTSSGAAGFLFIAAFLMGIWRSFIRRRLFS
jgi:MYXO-CTERM domain-containing protein